MKRISSFLFTLVLVAAALGMIACSGDESPVVPKPFAVTVTVTDVNGDPLPGMEISLAPDISINGEKSVNQDLDWPPPENRLNRATPNPSHLAIIVSVVVAVESKLRMSIEDVTGTEIRLLENGIMPVGSWGWYWDGRDEVGDPVQSGVYKSHMVLTDLTDDTLIMDESNFMVLIDLSSDSAVVGITDDDGKVVLTDKRLFPYLYNVPDFDATNEHGIVTGSISLTASMRINATDPDNGIIMHFKRDVTGAGNLSLVWDPNG